MTTTTTVRVNRDKVAISPRRADCNYHFPSRVGAVGQMQTGSRLGPRNRIRGTNVQKRMGSRSIALAVFASVRKNFPRFAKDSIERGKFPLRNVKKNCQRELLWK